MRLKTILLILFFVRVADCVEWRVGLLCVLKFTECCQDQRCGPSVLAQMSAGECQCQTSVVWERSGHARALTQKVRPERLAPNKE
jgi:hypothetical protein